MPIYEHIDFARPIVYEFKRLLESTRKLGFGLIRGILGLNKRISVCPKFFLVHLNQLKHFRLTKPADTLNIE